MSATGWKWQYKKIYYQNLLSERQLGPRANDSCSQYRLVTDQDRQIELELRDDFRQFICAWGGGSEMCDLATFRRVRRRMKRACTPFDEEGEQAIFIVFEIQGFPLKKLAVRTLTRAGARPVEADACFAQVYRELLKVTRMRGPSDQSRRAQLF